MPTLILHICIQMIQHGAGCCGKQATDLYAEEKTISEDDIVYPKVMESVQCSSIHGLFLPCFILLLHLFFFLTFCIFFIFFLILNLKKRDSFHAETKDEMRSISQKMVRGYIEHPHLSPLREEMANRPLFKVTYINSC